MLRGSVANFNAFQQCKNFENRLRFDEVTDSIKVGTFLRHSVLQTLVALVMTAQIMCLKLSSFYNYYYFYQR